MVLIFRKVTRRNWHIPLVGYLFFAVFAAAGGSSSRAGQQAQLASGAIRTGRITGENPAMLVFDAAAAGVDAAAAIPLTAIRQINFAARPRIVSTSFPPRRIDFRGGETLHAGFEAVDADMLTLAAFGSASGTVPRAALARVLQPAGERSLFYEDFEKRPTLFDGARLSPARYRSGRQSLSRRPGDGPLSFANSHPIAAGRIELSFFDTGVLERTQQWFVEVELTRGDQASTIRFSPGWSDSEYRCTASSGGRLAAQPVTRSKGWRRFSLLFDPQRVTALVDDRVLGTGSGAGSPTAIRFVNAAVTAPDGQPPRDSARVATDAGTVEAWIDDLQVFEHIEGLSLPNNTQPNDLLWLATGDELFGEILTVDPRDVLLAGKFGRRTFPWSELNGLVFAPGGAPAGEPVHGLVATIELAPILGANVGDCDRLVAALQRVTESELIAAHPYLGTLHVPLREIDRILPQFHGSLQLVDPAHHHLGNEIREDFTAKLAEGPRLARTFTLEAVPRQGLSVSLLAADLEPALSKEERFRHQLSAGHLRTELFINGRRVTDLNRLVSGRAHPANPQRLRIAVPAANLKAGENTLRIEQRPAGDDREEYDDCEISRLAVEIDAVTR